MAEIFNIPASNNFVETLASTLLKEYEGRELELANVLILLPNRRACRSLAEAFVRLKGMSPTLLPQMKAIGDVKEDELLLNGAEIAEEFLNLPPVIEPLERMMLFMRLVMGRYREFGLEKISLAQTCYLAQELGSLIDAAALQNLDWGNLDKLVPEEYAAHWQETLKFLAIVTKYWPEILSERGVIDAAARRNILIEKQAAIWQKKQPQTRIIVAGTTAVSPAMKFMVKVVSELPYGEICLAGLDKYLDDEGWLSIDETHPQFELKQLLEYLKIDRRFVRDLTEPANAEREKFISEVMRPAVCSHKWRNLSGTISKKSVEGIRLLECDDSRTEALAVAAVIRRALETKGKTIALVTPDRNLARRTAAELRRWDILADDSAGIPLPQTPWGIFMRLVVAAAAPDAGKETVLALLKNPFFAAGQNKSKIKNLAERLDKNVWRGGREDEEAADLLQNLAQKAQEVIRLFKAGKASLKELLSSHIRLAESLAETDVTGGDKILWQNDDGEAGAAFMAGWIEKADVLGEIDTEEYLSLFEAMMSGVMVRSRQNSHPRIRILGPMEARLNHFDEIILGGFNEGVWPVLPESDPWLSRPMKREFGFEQPEKQIGVLGLDFANLLGAEKVYISRAGMNGGTPTIKSRWLMRMETVLSALGFDKKELVEQEASFCAEEADKPAGFIKISAPQPRPPLSARPRKLSASAYEKLLRDPYGVFAEYILKLKPLDELEEEADVSDFGTVVHGVLEEFGKKYPEKYPDNAKEILLKMGQEAFEKSGFAEDKQAFWRPKFAKMAEWIAAHESEYRQNIKRIHNEVWGSFFIDNLPGGKFEIYAKADRVDETKDGKINIVDYKTGRARTATEVKKGYAPQLPIEGLIAEAGGFDGIKPAAAGRLMYWKLGDKIVEINEETAEVLRNTKDHIVETLNLFDFETTGYLSRPNPKNVPEYSDYEHLARVKEWSVKEEGEDE